jgi:branched-subunit amino acid transport protein
MLYPVALLAALVAVQTFSSLGQLSLDWRALGVGAGLIALLLRAPFVVVVLVAALVTAGARYLFG